MRAVRGAERVVDVQVVAARELLRERSVVLLFLRMEPHVLEQDHLAGTQLAHDVPHSRPDRVR